MSDSFANGPQPDVTKATDPPPRKRRGRKPKEAVQAAAAPKRKGRPPKATVKPPAMRLDLAVVMPALVGLKEQDAGVLAQAVNLFNTVSKGRRKKLITALGRLFA